MDPKLSEYSFSFQVAHFDENNTEDIPTISCCTICCDTIMDCT